MHTQTIEYQDQGLTFEGFYAFDEKLGPADKKPAVLVCHDWSGHNDFAREKAKKLAELGYLGFALDLFGKGKLGTTTEEKKAQITPLMNDRGLLRSRMLAALKALKGLSQTDHSKLAALGFCFGGLCALDLARSGADIKGAVSFHGLLSAPENLPSEAIKAKVLALHGYDDPMVPPEQLLAFAQEMTKAKVDWQAHVYGLTSHAFTNPKAQDTSLGLIYNPTAEHRSWQALKNFLTEIFGG